MWFWLWMHQSLADNADVLPIHEWPLPHQVERQKGMVAYFDVHYGPDAPQILEPRMVVLHWTGVPSASSTWNTFASATLGGRDDILGGGDVNVSSHFLIERDGTIHRLLPEDSFARHCIGFNAAEGLRHTKSFPNVM